MIVARHREPLLAACGLRMLERKQIEAPVKISRVRRCGDGRKRSKVWKTPVKNCDAIIKEKQNNQYSRDNQN